MSNCKPIDTHVYKGESLRQEMCPKSPNEIEKMTHVPYASATGSLMYAMMCTQVDMCSWLSQ